jgi:glycine betaine/proline transport system permease protein
MIGSRALSRARLNSKSLIGYSLVVVAAGVILALAMLQPPAAGTFPAAWNLHLRDPIDQFQSWVINHRASNPVFVFFFVPLSAVIDWGLRAVENVLLATPWPVIIAAFGLLGYWLGRWRLAVLAIAGLLFMGLMGLWTESMQTLALMTVSVAISLLIGIPLGIWCAQNPRVEALLRPILDGMQTMPAFVYLIPVLLFFGVARVPSVVATVIYALPPAIRLTSLGLRQVSPQSLEAARSFGSTRRQMLFKVQLPLALPSIMAGVNQTIMMALGIVVIAALIGAGGLGRQVLQSLQHLKVGLSLEAGLSIVFLAIILDRLSEGLSRIDLTHTQRPGPTPRWQSATQGLWQAPADLLALLAARASGWVGRPVTREAAQRAFRARLFLINAVLLLVVLWAVAALVSSNSLFPAAWRVPLNQPVDAVVAWMRDNLFHIGGSNIIGTGPLSDFITLQVIDPLRSLFVTWLPWPVVILLAMLGALATGGWRLSLAAGVGMFFLGLLGMWALGMDTLSQVLAAVVVTVAIALPLGILTSRSNRAQAVLRPLLDTLQTIPSFVFLVPVIMLFNVGRVPGLIAAVLYALAPGVKLIDLGIRQVAPEAVEAAQAFGSTYRQTLTKVLLPLSLPSIMLGINQIIMMVLAMVVISGLVGGAGLGLEAVTGLAKDQTGRGIEAGFAIVILAMILDRITQAWAAKYQQ